MAARFNPPPGWPPAPEGWSPGPGWAPDPAWPPLPPGWRLWVEEPTAPGVPLDPASSSVEAAPAPPADSKRAWYRKKRFLIPIGLVLLVGFLGGLGQRNSSEPTVAGPAPSSTPPAEKTVAPPSAEEIAAQAEAERVAAEQKAADEAAKAEADRVAAEAAAAAEAAKGTLSQQNAYASARSYLDFAAFSRAGLLDQLTSEYGEGFPAPDAEFAVARLEAEGAVDWNAEAAESAKAYLDFQPFSRQGLLDQLTSEYGEQFTPEQAEYGVSQAGL